MWFYSGNAAKEEFDLTRDIAISLGTNSSELVRMRLGMLLTGGSY